MGCWDHFTSGHMVVTQVAILPCIAASYLFLQVSQPGMPAEESRKEKVRKKIKPMTTVSLKVCLKDI